MDAREDILTAIRDRGPAPRELPRVPDFRQDGDDLAGLFTAALARLDGRAIPPPPAGLQQWLAATFPDATRICSAVPEVTGTITPDQFPDWAAPADVDVTVVRTPLGVAETGSILLTEKELGVNTIAVLAGTWSYCSIPPTSWRTSTWPTAIPASGRPPTRSCCPGHPDQPTSAASRSTPPRASPP